MNNKKTIFEKLGIVERVDSNSPETTEAKADTKLVVLDSHDRKKGETTFNLDRFLSIQEIYSKLNMPIKVTETVFIVESFLKALPQNLPAEVKRESVLNLISASGMELESLIRDGSERLKTLSIFMESFTDKTEDVICETEKEINRLLEQINKHKERIGERKALQDEQKATIEYETQKIHNIIQFIEPQT